jgi:diguanylate cyclase (GGDEF)-like protein
MNPIFFQILLLVGTAFLGALCGWAACYRIKLREQLQGEATKVREVLVHLNRLTEIVVADVRAHKRSVAHLTEELARIDTQAAQSVSHIVLRLVETNHELEQRLGLAERTLHEQTKEFEDKSKEDFTDCLTGLANRRGFNDELTLRFDEYERLQRPVSVILVDIDHFDQFNAQYGQTAGDEVLRGVATMLRQTVRVMDLVARSGGEEFGVVLPNTPLVVATAVAERIREAVAARSFRHEGHEFRITVSSGVAELRSSEHVAQLVRRADDAMYTSKREGRNRTHYHTGREILPSTVPADEHSGLDLACRQSH